MKEFELSQETLMGGWFISETLCDNIIEAFENNSSNTVRGVIERENGPEVDLNLKDSYDLRLHTDTPIHPFSDYMNELSKCLNLYTEKFPSVNYSASFKIIEKFGIQKYNPGGGFKEWHFEETGLTDRLLVFMTYLNDVDDGGTDFKYQNLSLPAKKGLTVIWPAHWTHTHRGVVSQTNTKYIATGWYSIDK